MTIIGLLLGALAVYIVMLHGQITQLIFNLDAFILVVGGTVASTLIAYPWSVIKEIPKGILMIFFPPKREGQLTTIKTIVQLAEKARKSGIEILQNDIHNLKNKFFANAIQMLIDGFEAELVTDKLTKETIYIRQRHEKLNGVFRTMATVSPVFGLLGTLIGVIQVLRNITSPQAMSSAMAVAVVTTFYGIFIANFLCIPAATKLGEYSESEILNMELISEGVISIQKGEVPVVIEKKLESFLQEKLREKVISK